jgi:arginase
VRVALIQVPYHLGHEGVGMGAGPDRLVDAGAVEELTSAGHDVDVVRIGRRNGETNEIGASFEVVRRVAETVAEATGRGAFPLVLSGNCMSSIGVVAGLGRDVGVVWLDAHPDFNTTEESLSGFADGMGLSILSGTGWRALRETVPGYRAVPESNVVLVGIRDINPPEQERLEASAVEVIAPAEATERIGPALDRLRGRVADAYLHLDLDVLDPSEGRANEYAAPGGIAAADVERIIDAVGDRLAIRGAAVTAYDPAADPEGRIPNTAARLMARIAAAAQAKLEVVRQ